MATPEFFNSEISYRDEHILPGDFATGAREPQSRNIPPNLPIASFTYRAIKPLADLIIVFLTLPILLPLGLVIAAIIRASSDGSALYRHRRIGQFQQPLYVWKFRTMYKDSDQLLEQCLSESPAARREWSETHKLRNDPRVTPIGRFLRKTSLDEIPQLINVLAGEMSIVGPRPIVDMEKAKYGMYLQMYSYAMPGITGLWQVSGRCDVSYQERVLLDVRYVKQWSLWMELKIILKTVFVMMHREGAY
jgi:lipopolysaccharide/colanic/teichoic acid biosynthesis glycosyltransferase